MGFRFRRSVKVFPGVRLNFSRSGISTTIGVRGASVTVGGRGTTVNLGIPGTGLLYRQRIDNVSGRSPQPWTPSSSTPPAPTELPLSPVSPSPVLAGEIRSADNEALTSLSLRELRELLAEAYTEFQRLRTEIPAADAELYGAQRRADKWQHGLLFKHILKKRYASILSNYEAAKHEREALTTEMEKCRVALELHMEGEIDTTYGAMIETFRALAACERRWDTTSSVAVDQFRARSQATSTITRTPVTLDLSPAEVIAPSKPAMHLQNANGADLFILPGLLLMFGSRSDFALIRLVEVRLDYSQTQFIETEGVPADTQVVGETWAKVNKDGSPDRRFTNNYRIPIVQYGSLAFKSAAGLNEEFLFSSAPKAEAFAKAFAIHRAALPLA